MKIYTKKGDAGLTSLIGGTRVPKDHIRIETYGTVDELNSYTGLLRDQAIHVHHRKFLLEIQDRLFTIGSLLASDPEASNMKLPALQEEDVLSLEKEMDAKNEVLPQMKSFVLPGGHPVISYAHIARCVCRRAERLIVHLAAMPKASVDPLIVKYMNRLSDYYFMLARKLSNELNAEEVPWKPRM